MYRLLIIEDDKEISEMIRDYLIGEAYIVDIAYDGKVALDLFNKNKYDLALVDLMLPSCSGLDIVKEIRKTSIIPIIIVTAKNSEMDKTMGFNLGADDYVTKPFSLIELSARIKANIRRFTRYINLDDQESNSIRFRDLTIYLTEHIVEINGKNVELTYTEFEILKILASHKGQTFSKERLYNMVWKQPYYGNENVLNTHINRLRSKLNSISKGKAEYIKTLWGIGYKMEEE